jgi:peptidoglycan/xylan/chitin deacetylase (PgdA/CDA1 family)
MIACALSFICMHRRILALFLAFPLLLAGCKKSATQARQEKKAETPVASASAAAPTPTPVAVATPTPTPVPVIDRSAKVMVLLYHRFEDRPKDSLSIPPVEFRQNMEELKKDGISVISMKDFLAWRRGEKSIPPKSAIITIDDGYTSAYSVAWPILKELGYPFTMFIYTNFVNVGGKSMTWAQLEEMRDAGVDIESHTISHHDLRHAPKRGDDYTAWLHNEIYGSKEILEQKLGIKIVAFAFPYGTHNEVVRKMAKEAGYEALFTVYGQHMGFDAPMDQLGRYAFDARHREIFKMAANFGANEVAVPSAVVANEVPSTSMVTQPANDEHTRNPRPTIKANMASLGDVDPNSVQMRISGLGLVPAKYDAQSKSASYEVTQNLIPRAYTVILSAKAQGKRVETRWNFTVDPSASGAPATAPAVPAANKQAAGTRGT